jgi:hypothetical protein
MTPAGETGAVLKGALDRLYASFNYPDSARDPVQIVRLYDRAVDREIVAFLAAGLAFGRVASVMASIEAVCAAMGPAPAAFVHDFNPARDADRLRPLVHRWTRGEDLVGLLWTLRQLIEIDGSLERSVARGLDPGAPDVEAALDDFSGRARTIDLRPAYGRRPRQPGAHYFFSRPSTGSPANASTCSCGGWSAATRSTPAVGRRFPRASSSCRWTRTRSASADVCG